MSKLSQYVDFLPFSDRFSSDVVLFNGTSVYFCARQTAIKAVASFLWKVILAIIQRGIDCVRALVGDGGKRVDGGPHWWTGAPICKPHIAK